MNWLLSKLLLMTMILAAISSYASEDYSVKKGYHLRSEPSLGASILRTTRKASSVMLIKQKGNWSNICVEKTAGVCVKGSKAWIRSDGLVEEDNDTDNSDSNTVKPLCQFCSHMHPNGVGVQAKKLAEISHKESQPKFKLPKSFAPLCSQHFINEDGLGPWGKAVIKDARKNSPNCFYNNNLFGKLCPNYRSLPDLKKDEVIAIAFASIAQTESSCNPSSSARGVNGTADGMFALEREMKYRAQAGRNTNLCKTDRPVDTQQMAFQAECSVSIVEDTVCGFGAWIFTPDGYWQELRGHREIYKRIYSTVRLAGLCKG